MKLACSPYTLQFRSDQRQIRMGALLRFEINAGHFGYADCHPWPELGDKPLAEQLRLLGQGVLTSLTARSLAFGQIDGAARSQGRNLLSELLIPASHYLVTDVQKSWTTDVLQAAQAGYQIIKLKVGHNTTEEIEVLLQWIHMLRPYKCKLRLDFNCRLSERQFLEYFQACKAEIDAIDFIEDPFNYDPLAWQIFRKKWGVRLACDHESERALNYPDSCDVLVIKPAVQDDQPFFGDLKGHRQLVYTSYLDHPLGQLTASYAAANACRILGSAVSICGLQSHHVYETNSFSKALSPLGIPIAHPYETGFGFDHLLRELTWKSLT